MVAKLEPIASFVFLLHRARGLIQLALPSDFPTDTCSRVTASKNPFPGSCLLARSLALRVAVLAPLVVLVVQLAGEGHVGDDDDVEGRGRIAGGLAGVAAGVVLVLARGARLPGHAALGDVHGVLGGGCGGGAAFFVFPAGSSKWLAMHHVSSRSSWRM